MKIGRVFGIEVVFHPSLLIFALVVLGFVSAYLPKYLPILTPLELFLLSLSTMFMAVISILAHEFGHCLSAKRLGIEVEEIVLFVFGGFSRIDLEMRRPLEELKIAIAGPLVNLAIALTCFIAMVMTPKLTYGPANMTCLALGFINLGLAISNLIPGSPFDGGWILELLIWAITKNRKTALKTTSFLGKLLGISIVTISLLLVVIFQDLLGLLFAFFGIVVVFLAEAAYREFLSKSSEKKVFGFD